MSLTPAEIAEIARLLDASHFADLKLEIGDFRLRIRRDGHDPAPSRPGPAARDDARPAPAPAPHPAVTGAPGSGEVDVPAPLLGNFYRAPRPGDPDFITVGQRVEEDTVIGIIEVMKLMNSVRAGVSGTVVAILAENAAAIEEGQPLIRVRVEG